MKARLFVAAAGFAVGWAGWANRPGLMDRAPQAWATGLAVVMILGGLWNYRSGRRDGVQQFIQQMNVLVEGSRATAQGGDGGNAQVVVLNVDRDYVEQLLTSRGTRDLDVRRTELPVPSIESELTPGDDSPEVARIAPWVAPGASS